MNNVLVLAQAEYFTFWLGAFLFGGISGIGLAISQGRGEVSREHWFVFLNFGWLVGLLAFCVWAFALLGFVPGVLVTGAAIVGQAFGNRAFHRLLGRN